MAKKSDQPPGSESPLGDALTVDQALGHIEGYLTGLQEQEMVALDDCVGRITAQPVASGIAVPAFRNSSMDGYAFNYSNTPKAVDGVVTFNEIGVSLAGHPYTGQVNAGECVRITTGAMLPDDCNTVVIRENTGKAQLADGTGIVVNRLPAEGENVREIGCNIASGESLCGAGTRIQPALLGLIASTGVTHVPCVRPIKVTVFSTGDELVLPGEQPAVGQIFDANGYLLKSMLQSPNIEVTDLGIVGDSISAVREAMQQGMQTDLVISSGGVSVGEADVVKQVLEELGEQHMWKIRMKPGKPLTFGTLESGTRYFGLPGNPVSAMVTFAVFVVPALRKLLGLPVLEPRITSAVCSDKLHKVPGRMELQRGILEHKDDGSCLVKTTGMQDSHILSSMAKANCYIRLPIESAGTESGETVEVIPFDELRL